MCSCFQTVGQRQWRFGMLLTDNIVAASQSSLTDRLMIDCLLLVLGQCICLYDPSDLCPVCRHSARRMITSLLRHYQYTPTYICIVNIYSEWLHSIIDIVNGFTAYNLGAQQQLISCDLVQLGGWSQATWRVRCRNCTRTGNSYSTL